MSTVTLNANERETVIDGLIGEECCFEENERPVLNSLSDRTLARLTVNAGLIPGKRKLDAEKNNEDTYDNGGTDEDDEAPLPKQVLNFDPPAFDRPGVTGGGAAGPTVRHVEP